MSPEKAEYLRKCPCGIEWYSLLSQEILSSSAEEKSAATAGGVEGDLVMSDCALLDRER